MKKYTITLMILVMMGPLSFAQIKVQNGGNVVIGNSNPGLLSEKLFVDGSAATSPWQKIVTTEVPAHSSGNYTLNYVLTPTGKSAVFYVREDGKIYSQGLWIGSDSRLKSNVKTIDGALDKIKQLRGVTYDYHTPGERGEELGESQDHQVGFIAQELEAVIPEVVTTRHDGYKAVAYQNLTSVLVEGIKEQQVIIEAQNERLDRLEAQVKALMEVNNVSPSDVAEFEVHATLGLDQNIPNPFSDETIVNYTLPQDVSQAQLMVFNLRGELVKRVELDIKGNGSMSIAARELSAGMYLYSLFADGKEIDTKRMVITDQ